MKIYDYRINSPVPRVGVVTQRGDILCNACARDQEGGTVIFAKATYSDELCDACKQPLMFFTKIYTRFGDGSTHTDDETRSALVCGLTANARGGVVYREPIEYAVVEEV